MAIGLKLLCGKAFNHVNLAFTEPFSLARYYESDCCLHNCVLVVCLQWFAVHRKHALLIVSDYLYYNKFKDYCRVCVHSSDLVCIDLYLSSMKLLLPPHSFAI